MPGTVIAVQVGDGDSVVAGQVLASIEAMKMEHQMLSPGDGIVRMAHLKVGDLVKANQVIATVEVEPEVPATGGAEKNIGELEHSA